METAAAILLILGVVVSQRIALANILIGLAFLTWLAALIRGSASWRRAAIHPALLAWAVSALLSVAFSVDPASGVPALWGLLTMVVVPMSVSLLDRRRWDWMFAGLAAWGVLSSAMGLWQYFHGASGLDNRLHGFVSHYMTYSGWTLMVILLLVADILFNRPGRRVWTIPVCGLCFATLVLTYTRGTWLGCAAGLTVLAGLWRPKAAVVVPVLAVALAVAAPTTIRQRALSILDPGHPSNYDRICMARAGMSMVADHPVTGIGLEMVKPRYEDYRVPGSIMDRPPHLHSNPIHIAAERGLLGLAAYLWVLAAFAAAAWQGLRRSDGAVSWEIAGAAAAVLGISVSGLFEYYWGDAEVWIVTLACLATPYALSGRNGS